MQKIISVIAVLSITATLGTTSALAHGHGGQWNNGSGDTASTIPIYSHHSEACAYVDANGDYICDTCTLTCICGGAFVDVNEDGICDNYAASIYNRGCNGRGHHGGKHHR